MDEKELWERFKRDGKVEDYLEYRRYLDMLGKMELDQSEQNQYTGIGDPGTKYW